MVLLLMASNTPLISPPTNAGKSTFETSLVKSSVPVSAATAPDCLKRCPAVSPSSPFFVSSLKSPLVCWAGCPGSAGRPASETTRGDFSELTKKGEEGRSEEHTSELQSHSDLVCRLLLEKT